MAGQKPKSNGLWPGVAAVAALLVAERLRPRRMRTQAEPARTARNLALGLIDMGVVAGVQQPLARRLAVDVERRRLGLAQQLPAPLRDVAAFLLLDWSMYHWHVATHRVALLWRLHLVHHVDRDMDASTALRFHGLDMVISVGLRAAQVRILGVSPCALAAWEGFFFGSVLFHHANIAVPGDAGLAWVLTTPGMHDIHHRADAASLDANFSSGLSFWDRLHGTFSHSAPDVPIGVPGVDADQGLAAALLLPFQTESIERPRLA